MEECRPLRLRRPIRGTRQIDLKEAFKCRKKFIKWLVCHWIVRRQRPPRHSLSPTQSPPRVQVRPYLSRPPSKPMSKRPACSTPEITIFSFCFQCVIVSRYCLPQSARGRWLRRVEMLHDSLYVRDRVPYFHRSHSPPSPRNRIPSSSSFAPLAVTT